MASREPSAAPSSGADTIDDHEDVKPTLAELDHEDSAADLPVTSTPASGRSKKTKTTSLKKKPKKGSTVWINEGPADGTEDEGAPGSSVKAGKSGTPDADSRTLGTAVGTRRQANGTVGSVYSGSKVRHIKKPDGTPLWRKEIQYEFLKLVIEDTTPVFTRISDGKKNCNFADIYIDCMARSSKTSKILKDRLQVDRQAAQNMAMICLLVNVGRMNTTLNFFPEMRAQLRTYHSIPSLQAYKSQQDYKSLQDAPRLKSILKGASEDTDEPRTLPAVKAAIVPRTNPVNLIFVLSQFAPDVAQMHFIDKVDFFDLAIRPTITSRSRAKAFLWLMWWYLESTTHDRQSALDNPFGPGEFKEDQDPNDPKVIPQLVPKLINITEEEGDLENVDPPEEKAFADKMTKQRARIMTEDRAKPSVDEDRVELKALKRLKSTAKEFDDDSDMDSRASPGYGRSPAGEGVMGMMSSHLGDSSHIGQADSIEDDWEAVNPHPGRGRYKRIKGKNTPSRSKNRISEGLVRSTKGARASGLTFDRGTPDTIGARGTPQPLPPGGANHPILSQFSAYRQRQDLDGGSAPTKSRARTGYQRQLEEHKNSRIEWLLRKKRRDTLKDARGRREQRRWLSRLAFRVSELDATYNSEEDDEMTASIPFGSGSQMNASGNTIGIGGLIASRAMLDISINHNISDENYDSQNPSKKPLSLIEDDDYGEEAETWLKIFKRTRRRLKTWSGEKDYQRYLDRTQPPPIIPTTTNNTNLIEGLNNTTTTNPLSRPIRSSTTTIKSTSAKRGGSGGGGGKKGTGRISSAATRKSELSLNEEITLDLLAERSDEDDDEDQDGDGDDVDVDGDEVDGDDVDGDADIDMTMDETVLQDGGDDIDIDIDGDGDGDGEADGDSDGDGDGDVDMD